MNKVKEMIENLPISITNKKPSKSFLNIFRELAFKTSSTSLFQVIDEELLEKLKAYCHGNKDQNFVQDLENVQLQNQLRREYPVVTKIIMDIEKKRSGMLLVCVGLGSIIQHTLDFHRSLSNDNQSE